MKTILILAGLSKRFWPLSDKNSFPIVGTTLLQEQLRRLRAGGAKDILLVVGAHNKAVAKKLAPGIPTVEQKDLTLGMRGALLSALPKVKKGEPVLIVSANDVIEPLAYKALLAHGRTVKEGGLILARKVKNYFPGGYISLKGKRIVGILEKPGIGNEPSQMVTIVAHVHASGSLLLEALKTIRPTKDDGYEQALNLLFEKYPYKIVSYTGYWQAVKYPWHLLELLPSLLRSDGKPDIHKSASIHRTAVIEGPVVLREGVKVFAHASVIGPCFIGKDTIIANNALVRGSSVGERSVIGYQTEVARSIIGNDVWTHSSYIGDSVFGNNISLGAGTVTGNLRLDEEGIVSKVHGEVLETGLQKFGAVVGDGVRTGIHTSLAPGVKIGAHTFINSASIVTEDIPDGSFVTMERSPLRIRPNTRTQRKPEDRKAFRKGL